MHGMQQTLNTGLRHPSSGGQLRGDKECPFSGVILQFGGRCRKAMLGVWACSSVPHPCVCGGGGGILSQRMKIAWSYDSALARCKYFGGSILYCHIV